MTKCASDLIPLFHPSLSSCAASKSYLWRPSFQKVGPLAKRLLWKNVDSQVTKRLRTAIEPGQRIQPTISETEIIHSANCIQIGSVFVLKSSFFKWAGLLGGMNKLYNRNWSLAPSVGENTGRSPKVVLPSSLVLVTTTTCLLWHGFRSGSSCCQPRGNLLVM